MRFKRLSRKPRLALLVLSLSCPLVLLAGACGQNTPPTEFRYHGPLLFVGVDGLDWDLMIPLLRRGKLPHFAEIIGSGSIGVLDSTKSEFLPVTWTSLATGKPPDQHGIRGSIWRSREEGGARRPYNQDDRITKAFWNILSEHDRRSAIVGWWLTYPVEQIRGVMVAQTNSWVQMPEESVQTSSPTDSQAKSTYGVHPPNRRAELLAINRRVESELPARLREIFKGQRYPTTPTTEKLWGRMLQSVRSDLSHIEIAHHLVEDEFDIVALYLSGASLASQEFLPYRFPEKFTSPPSAEQSANFGSIINDYYRFIDNAIGKLAEALPQRRDVLIVSLHGVSLRNRRTDLASKPSREHDSQFSEGNLPGVIIASGNGFKRSSRPVNPTRIRRARIPQIGSVFDVTPTLLAYFDIPVGSDMTGRPISSLLRTKPTYVSSHDPESTPSK